MRSGVFAGGLAPEAEAFNSSLPFDRRLYRYDIDGSIAHASMLGRQGIIPPESASAIIGCLRAMREEEPPMSGAEDIHSYVERELTARVGEAGKTLHTARSRNDQVATDLRLWCKDTCSSVSGALRGFIMTLVAIAEGHLHTIMPGYTHLQRAQPVTLAHHLAAWCEMLRRDISRVEDARERMDECPLGCGALAGTVYPVDRAYTARELGFARLCANAQDAVADRDFAAELCAALSIIMLHLSRMAQDVINWVSAEFAFAQPDERYASGSSIMPQKKNPDIAELTRGKAGRVFGSLLALLTMLKGLPLAYNKDMQEDKEPLFDAADTVLLCLQVFPHMVAGLTFSPGNMLRAAREGFLNATDCADYLVRKGLPFREAHHITGALARHCSERGVLIEDLTLQELRGFSPLFERDVFAALDLRECVAARACPGGPAPSAVQAHLDELKRLC
jgi:argininosuccinate lyase